MSILVINSRRTPAPPDATPDLEAALVAVSAGRDAWGVAVAGSLHLARAEDLRRTAIEIETPLLTEIAAGNLPTKTDAVDWVRARTDKFPAVKYLDLLILLAGGTYAKLKTEAALEVA